MSKILLLLTMIFMHIVDDYYLQGWLASAKQKSWWKQNSPDELYKYDYIMALFMHSFSWAFMIMIVPSLYALSRTTEINTVAFQIVLVFIFNLLMHMGTDHSKANLKRINLVQDQLIHLFQIVWTWMYLVLVRL